MRLPIPSFLIALALLLGLGAHAAEPAAPLSYSGKTVLITGSTDGLGRELARALAADGAHVIVHGRNTERGMALVDEITATGVGSARFVAADFASLDAVKTFANTSNKTDP